MKCTTMYEDQSFYHTRSSILHWSVEYGDEKMTQHFLDSNYDVNLQNFNGITPLMIAIRNKQETMINILLNAGADTRMLNHKSESALHMFCAEHDFSLLIQCRFFRKVRETFLTREETAQCFIDAGCHLYQAACLDDFEIIKYMLERGVSVDSANPLTKQTALHVAIIAEGVEIVKLLLEYGANIYAVDSNDCIPMFYIYRCHQELNFEKMELLKIFLNQEISPTSSNSLGLFHIGIFLIYGNSEAIRIVLKANIDFTAKDEGNGRSVLHYFAMNKKPGVLQELKPYLEKCDVNVVDQSGISPLHVAIKYCNVDMVEFLLSQGAEANCAGNQKGVTPLYVACIIKPQLEDQWHQCLELLLQHKADPQCVVTKANNQRMTVFDAAEKTNCIYKTKPIIAHLALLEGLGVTLTESILTKINSYPLLKKYFGECQKLIRKKICGSVTVLKLLTDNEKRIVQYSGNDKLMLKLYRLNYKQNLKLSYSYYHNTLEKRISKGIESRRFLDKVAEVICKLFGSRFDKTNLIINNIIDYLNDESLCQLFKLSNVQ